MRTSRRSRVAAAVAISCSEAPSTADAHAIKAQRSVETSINAVRAKHGCGPLRLPRAAWRASPAMQARLLLADGGLDHDAGTPLTQRLQRAAPGMHLLGEDLAWSTPRVTPQPASIVRAWLRSPVHREVLLDCRFSRLGIGIASGHFGRHGKATVYTADLAA